MERFANVRSRGQALPVLGIGAETIQFFQRQQGGAHYEEATCRQRGGDPGSLPAHLNPLL
jgi:hypothetical protein